MANDSLGKAILELVADGTGLKGDLDSAESRVRTSVDLMQGLLASIGIGFSLKAVIDATIEAEHESTLLAAAVKATGMAAGFTTEQLKAQQAVLQASTGIGDEAISSMQRALMRFRNVHGEVFKSAIQLSLDFAAQTGGDATDAVRKFGMALNDPINGLTRLRREGIAVTDALENQVKALVANGDLVGAQNLIIKELSKSYEGAAVAARNTLGGALNALKENFGNLFLEQDGAGKQLRIFIELVNQSLPTVAAIFSGAFATIKYWVEGAATNIFKVGESLYYFAKAAIGQASVAAALLTGNISGAQVAFATMQIDLAAAGDAFTEIQSPAQLAAGAVAAGTLAYQETTASMNAATLAAQTLAATEANNTTQSILDIERKRQAEADAHTAKMAEELKAYNEKQNIMARLKAADAKDLAEKKARDQQRAADWAATLSAISTLSQSHNKTMAAIGKTAAIAQATIDTYVGVGKAWSLGPLIGPPMAALVLTAGLANVARIAGVQGLEKGGPMAAGQTALVGEAGPELFTAPRAGHIIPNGEFGGSNSVQVVNNISVHGLDFSSPTIAERILEGIADAAKRGTESAIPAARAFSDLSLAYAGRVA